MRKHGVLIYMAADNNLNPYGRINDLKEIQASLSDQAWPLAIQFHSPPEEGAGILSLAFIEGHEVARTRIVQGINTGKPEYLLSFLEWGIKVLDCEEYSLIIWGHGSGPLDAESQAEFIGKAVGFDFTDDDSLTTKEMLLTLSKFLSGKKFSMLGFDACYMGSLEVAYELSPLFELYIGSESAVPVIGWPYDLILSEIAKKNPRNKTAMGEIVVNNFLTKFNPNNPACISAVNSDNLPNLVNNLSLLVKELMYLLNDPKVFLGIHRSNARATRFGESFIDLFSWCKGIETNLSEQSKITKLTNVICKDIENVIISHCSQNISNANGISIMFPPLPLPDKLVQRYSELEFNKKTKWDQFVNSFLKGGV